MIERPREACAVAREQRVECALGELVEASVRTVLDLEHPAAQQRRERQRDEAGDQNRKYHSRKKQGWPERETRDTSQLKQRDGQARPAAGYSALTCSRSQEDKRSECRTQTSQRGALLSLDQLCL